MTTADRIRAYAIDHFIDPARKQGKRTIIFGVKEISKGMNLKNQNPNICSAIDGAKFLQLASVIAVDREGPKQSSSVCWKFELIESEKFYELETVLESSQYSKQKKQKPVVEPVFEKKSEVPSDNKKIVLISCVKSKLNVPAQAKDLYISPQFKYSLKYAYKINADKIFILSAKYGLLELDQLIDPYEQTLSNQKSEQKAWAVNVLNSLETKTNLFSDYFIILAGKKYREYLIPAIKNCAVPFEGLRQG